MRPYVVKPTTPSTYSILGIRGLASSSTRGIVHVQLAQGGKASPTYVFQPDGLLVMCQYSHTRLLHRCRASPKDFPKTTSVSAHIRRIAARRQLNVLSSWHFTPLKTT